MLKPTISYNLHSQKFLYFAIEKQRLGCIIIDNVFTGILNAYLQVEYLKKL